MLELGLCQVNVVAPLFIGCLKNEPQNNSGQLRCNDMIPYHTGITTIFGVCIASSPGFN